MEPIFRIQLGEGSEALCVSGDAEKLRQWIKAAFPEKEATAAEPTRLFHNPVDILRVIASSLDALADSMDPARPQ